MATVARLLFGPEDHGRAVTVDEVEAAEYQEGYRYEVIRGRLYVAAAPNLSEAWLDRWIDRMLSDYSRNRPDILKHVSVKPRVFVPDEPELTVPEPDLAAYREFPTHLPLREMRWEDVSPILVVEVLSPNAPEKDLVRNVDLYHRVPSIKEYWILDGRPDPDEPTLIVHVRHGKGWRTRRVAYGETYTTRLLPDFALVIDPRR